MCWATTAPNSARRGESGNQRSRSAPQNVSTPATVLRYLSPVELRDSPDEAAFRAEVRGWLAEHNPGLDGLPDVDAKRAWSRKIYDAGYAGLTWPEEYGGRGASYSN